MEIYGHATYRSLRENYHEVNVDNVLKISVLLLFTISNGNRFPIGMVRGMKLFLYGSLLAKHCM